MKNNRKELTPTHTHTDVTYIDSQTHTHTHRGKKPAYVNKNKSRSWSQGAATALKELPRICCLPAESQLEANTHTPPHTTTNRRTDVTAVTSVTSSQD